MKNKSRIFSALVCVPVLLGGTAWAAEKPSNAFVYSPDGKLVRSASGDCLRTPAWNAAAALECAGATGAAAPAPAMAKTEAKPVVESASAAAPAAPAPVVAETPPVAALPAAPEPPVVVAAPAVKEAAPVAATPVATKTAVEKINLSGAALFEFDRAELKPGAQKQLSELAGKVKSQKELDELVITGYADATGPEIYNEELSKKRAESVKAFLLQQGVVSKRVVIQAMGEDKPVASNDTAEGRAQNRRVEVSIKGTDSQ